MKNTRKIHDGIVGAVIVIGVALGFYANPSWFWLPGIIGALMIQSAFTGFCPVYFLLAKSGLKE
jgi:Inner membrane protein YgaP-like, transmembrane domain